jgi:hypothetical protein
MSAHYEKAIAWIAQKNPKRPRNVEAVCAWRVVNLTAALFSKAPRQVAEDVVDFARETEGRSEEARHG